MGRHDDFRRILAALHEAALDAARWPAAASLIDEACGTKGNALVVSEKSAHDLRIHFRACYYRGERIAELEQHYFRNYHQRDERVPRIRQLPDGLLVHTPDLYTEGEKKTSPAYNESLLRSGERNGLAVRLDGPNDTSISWVFADPAQPGGWGSGEVELVAAIVPHLRQAAYVWGGLAEAGAAGGSITQLLDSGGIGVIVVDRQGRIAAANDRGRGILRRGRGLREADGELRGPPGAGDARLQALLKGALPMSGRQVTAGSMAMAATASAPGLVVHTLPLVDPYRQAGGWHLAALVLVREAAGGARLEARRVAAALRLTAAESRVAVALAAGWTVAEIASATGRDVSDGAGAHQENPRQARPDGAGRHRAGAADDGRAARRAGLSPAAAGVQKGGQDRGTLAKPTHTG